MVCQHWSNMGILSVDNNFLCDFVVEHSTSFRRSESKKARIEEPNNNIRNRRCELKATKPVSERSEGASGFNVGYMTKLSASEM